MLILFIILVAIGSYVYQKYAAVSNKKDFFTSNLFVSLAGNIIIILLAFGFVNIIAPEKIIDEDEFVIHESDTTFESLGSKTPYEHYELINYWCENNEEDSIRQQYGRLTKEEDTYKKSIGEFGLGLITYHDGASNHAVEHFNNVLDKTLPLLNYCQGRANLDLNDTTKAVEFFKRELEIEGGEHKKACIELVSIHEARNDFEKIAQLFTTFPEVRSHFPDLTRRTYWHEGDIGNYLIWTYKSIYLDTPMVGIVAAILIALVWLVYLIGLNAFSSGRVGEVALMFFCGLLYIPIIFVFNDFNETNLSWDLNGSFLNDLAYSITLIGIPEEFTKAFPLFLFLLFGGRFKEPIDYVIAASASAVGFAFLENILYFKQIDGGIIHGRAYMSVIGHMVDSSIVVYGFVVGWFKKRNKLALLYTVPISFLAASLTHGIYDALVFQHLTLFFLIFFVFTVQVWIIIVNNCLNNSPKFSYLKISGFDRSRLYITFGLTFIFAFEYITAAFSSGYSQANSQFLANIIFAGLMIIFFSSNLSSFDLIYGYWRDIYFSSKERRGYGTIPQASLFIRWYLVNSIQAHNYVGLKIIIANDRYNKILADYIPEPLLGTVVDRIMLTEEKDLDPHWFLVKLDNPILFPSDNSEYILVKHRYQNDSLLDGMEAQAFFRAIPDLALVETPSMVKETFPFYGWVTLAKMN